MKSNRFWSIAFLFAAVLFAYGQANAQVPEKVKDAAGKVKDVTVDAADKTGDAASATGKAVKSTSKTIGHHTINVTEDVAGTAYEGGKWFMVTTWDGTKWVSKRTWYETKKVAGKTKDAVQ